MRETVLTVFVTEEIHLKLKVIAAKEGKTLKQICSEAFNDYISKVEEK